jgi:hypothetical protein
MSGYITESYDSFDKPLPPCSDEDKRKYREFLTSYYQNNADARREIEMYSAVSNKIDEKVAICHLVAPNIPIDSTFDIETQTTPLPFNLWKSNAPLIRWCGSLLHFIYLIAATSIIGTFFIFVVFTRSASSGDE